MNLYKLALLPFGPLMIALGLTRSLLLAYVFVLPIGMIMVSMMIADRAITQSVVPGAFRGRLLSTNEAIMSSAYLLSAALSGWLTDLIGVRTVYVAVGLVLLLSPGRRPRLAAHRRGRDAGASGTKFRGLQHTAAQLVGHTVTSGPLPTA